jgi:hypothetical protein
MNDVDIAGQLRSYYETIWYLGGPLFLWALDTALVNSYLVYKDCPQTTNIKHKDLRT